MGVFPGLRPERRAGPRHPLRTNAIVTLPDGRQNEVRTMDISGGGMGVVADINPRPGSVFALRVNLPLHPKGYALFEAQVRVANCVFDGVERGFRMGLEFVALDDEARQALERVFA